MEEVSRLFLGEANKAMGGQSKSISQSMQDRNAMQEFQKLEEGVVADPSLNIMTPIFQNPKTGGKKAKEAEALAQVFNQRKQEVLARKTMPGVSQTRTM